MGKKRNSKIADIADPVVFYTSLLFIIDGATNGIITRFIGGGKILLVLGIVGMVVGVIFLGNQLEGKSSTPKSAPGNHDDAPKGAQEVVQPPKEAPTGGAADKQRVCAHCGHVYAPGDTFCTECGGMETR